MEDEHLNTVAARRHLYVADSTIPNAGKGLFAAKKIQKHDFIAFYHGDFVPEEEETNLDPDTFENYKTYGIQPSLSKHVILCLPPCAAAYANEAPSRKEQNAFSWSIPGDELFGPEHKKKNVVAVALFAQKCIYPNNEILTHYGEEYDRNNTYTVETPFYPLVKKKIMVQNPLEVLRKIPNDALCPMIDR